MKYSPQSDYHSALKPVEHPSPPRQSFTGRYGDAFVWDIGLGLPLAMLRLADVLYADLPFPPGYAKFAARAGTMQIFRYSDLMQKLGVEVRRSGKPAVFTASKQAVKALAADGVVKGSLNGGDVAVCTWHYSLSDGCESTDVLRQMAEHFSVVGDPFCGYGRAGRIFALGGKRYVMSDFNPECIGHIAEHEGDWSAA